MKTTEESNYEAAKNFTCLCVLGSQDQVFRLQKVTQKIKAIDAGYKVTKTTYEKFKEGKKEDKYHCVMMLLLDKDLNADDLIKLQEHYDYYATVPIFKWGISLALTSNEEA